VQYFSFLRSLFVNKKEIIETVTNIVIKNILLNNINKILKNEVEL